MIFGLTINGKDYRCNVPNEVHGENYEITLSIWDKSSVVFNIETKKYIKSARQSYTEEDVKYDVQKFKKLKLTPLDQL